MRRQRRGLNFEELVRELREPMIGEGQLSIWTGLVTAEDLPVLLSHWGLPYRIWEFSSEILFVRDQAPPADRIPWLERGRMFGLRGDLTVRRDAGMFLWHFVGPKGEQTPEPPLTFRDFFQEHRDAQFYTRDEDALLWGLQRRKGVRRTEPRVGGAVLDYPGMDGVSRVRLKFRTLSREGWVEFVMLQGLEPASGEEETDG